MAIPKSIIIIITSITSKLLACVGLILFTRLAGRILFHGRVFRDPKLLLEWLFCLDGSS